MTAHITPRKVLLTLSGIIVGLVLLHGVIVVAEYGFGDRGFMKLRALFDLNREQNIPTLFSTLQLLLASLLCAVLGAEAVKSRRRGRYYWAGLALIFAFLAGDEFCQWHEHLIDPMRRSLHVTGALSFAWVIPYSALVALFAGGYARFWWRLDPAIRWRVAAAGVIYVGGGIGMEMLGSELFTLYGWESVQFDVECMVEEGMEMFGVALFVHALLLQLQQRVSELRLTFGTTDTDSLLTDAIASERTTNEVLQQTDIAA